jgi:3-(3-hydroxy-phenyl)propionate hydroxylase
VLQTRNPGPTRFGHRVVGVTQNADGITARVETASGPREISAPYLLGADGASSTVPWQLGVEFEGLTYPVRYLVLGTTFDFATHFPDLADVAYIFDPEGYMVLLRVPGLWRVLFACHAEESDEAALEGRSVERRLRRFVGHAATFDVQHKTIFRVLQRVASTFRRGCVLLLGDAAHINSPIGGMGMNGGIHDAWFLANCLARVLRGEASETMLDSWAEVRRRIALDVVRAETHRTTETLGRTGAAIRAQRNDEFARLAADPALARQYLLRSSMIAAVRGHP